MEETLQELNKSKDKDALIIARKILVFLQDHRSEDILWQNYSLIEVFSRKKTKYIWKSIQECYLDAPVYEETGFRFAESIHKKYLISDRYMELNEEEKKQWIAFLKENGAFWNIHVDKIENDTRCATGIDTDYCIENLSRYLSVKNVSLSRYIWKMMLASENWNHSYTIHYYQEKQYAPEKTTKSSVLTSFIRKAWIPDLQGTFKKPENVSRATIDRSFLIDETNGFLKDIQFGAKVEHSEGVGTLSDRKLSEEECLQFEAARQLGFESPEEVLISKENSRKVDELRRLGIDIDALLMKKRHEKKEKERKSLEAMFQARKDEDYKEERKSEEEIQVVKNPERRRDKLEKRLEEYSQETVKTIHVTPINETASDVRLFLKEQYNGVCQVCKKYIVKKNGSRYFEATNLLDTSELDKVNKKDLSNGWNSLCLCPNCAAEYRYGSVSLYDFSDQVMSVVIDRSVDDYIEFPIKMQGEDRILRYTPVHLFHLQTALQYFTKSNKRE